MTIVYFVALSLIFGVWGARKMKGSKDYFNAAKRLAWPVVMCSLVLAPLGSGHTTSLWQQAGGLGVSAVWWGILSGGIFLPFFMLWCGPWLRHLNVDTFPQALKKMFGPGLGFVNASVAPGAWLGIALAEVVATATAIYALTAGAIPLTPWCIIIAGVLVVIYVIFAGMLQVAWMNVLNAIVLIGGSMVAVFFTGKWLNEGGRGGWDGIADFWAGQGQEHMTDMFSFRPEVLFGLMIPIVVLCMTSISGEQAKYQPCLAAKSDADCRKGIFFGGIINSVAAFPWVVLGLVALAIPSVVTAMGGDVTISVPALALQALPPPLIGLIIMALLAATLSTASGLMLACSQVVVSDILRPLTGFKMTDKNYRLISKLLVIVFAVAAVVPSLGGAPMLMPVFFWCFSFGMPLFISYFVGMVWRVNKKATWITLIVAYVVNFIWTFWTPEWAGNLLMGNFALNFYPVFIVSIVLSIVLTLVIPGGEPGYLRRIREQEANDPAIVEKI
jgi:SSS family solute:Na+ symporter